MNFRTKEHLENRIAALKAKGEVQNAKLISKVQRQLNKLS